MKTTPSFRLLTLVGAVAFVLSAPVGKAILLDWDTLIWTPGALSMSYDIDPGNLGNDVTISITGDTLGYLTGGSPKISSTLTGGIVPPEKSLLLQALWDNTTQNIKVTVDFHYAVGIANVNYSIFDVDTGVVDTATAVDQIRGISASTLVPGSVGPTITTSSANALTGSGPGATDQVVTGTATSPATSANGNVDFAYAGSAITQFVFTFGNDASASTPPADQAIALHDISFTPVPEAGTVAACAVVSLLGAWGLRRMRRGQPESVES